jgi:hypothetical protein
LRHHALILRREFGITDEDLFERWDYWQATTYMEAASEVLEALNAPTEEKPQEGVAVKDTSLDDLESLGFNVVRKGGKANAGK